VLEKLCSDLVAAGIERNDTVLAFGGGVAGDLAGFVASIVLRGIDFIQLPTSLLAQVDSSVGGKTGINLAHGKNLVGAFHQPRLVLIDPSLLNTLDARLMRAGYAEIAKAALINDADFFTWLERNLAAVLTDTPERAQAIYKACRMKAEIVVRDEIERNERMLLNFGHTFGHALEALTGYSDVLLHGEAVGIGMAMSLRFSVQRGLCAADEAARAISHFERAGLAVSAKGLPGVNAENLLGSMLKDKKVTGGQITLILTRGIGKAFIARDAETKELAAFLQREMT
jgi:3-dehydroquinate synthase